MHKGYGPWETKLEAFKRQERPECVLMLAGSAELTRIALAWSVTPLTRKRKLKPCTANDEEGLWRWLWDNINFSEDELLARVPKQTSNTMRDFAALVSNRVLYPDGTVNSYAHKYMKEKVLQLFGIRRRSKLNPGRLT